ncbi:PglL family O-oligosaccharyltransferase [Agarivorans sp. 1_MG-2023]|uniref:PglL family O-oligosaccharyltransferase n=1 Tax=Agarivorans sp. 1_MG-2023 TaxID=3062634 RepID=UPI0026E34C93|nr:Wzy polymerase domain-containing protein [Agarivorans sp. 1_MG-2023]MDO6763541.1 Wzy polymerase domain-containing protein [Agarivorans sp. 1_MG-2023]
MSAKLTLERCFIYVFAVMMLVGMHYFQHNQGGTGLALPFNLVVWMFASVLIGIGLIKVSAAEQLRYNQPLIVLLAGVGLLWIPLFYPNAEFGEFALDRLIGLSAGLLLIFAFMQLELTRKDWHLLLFLIVAGALIESAYALSQMYLLTEGNWVGFNVNSTRAAGIFQQPNVLGTFVLFGPLASAWLISDKAITTKAQLTLVAVTSFLAAWVCFLSGSRTTTLSLFLILPLLAPYLFKTSKKKELRVWLCCIALGVVASSIPEMLGESVARDAIGGVTTAYRITMLEVSWELFKQQPLLGWGYGGYDGVYHEAQALLNQQNIIDGYHFNVAHPHNELAYWAVEGGILPILVLLTLAGYCLKLWFTKGWQKGLFYFAILLPSLLHSMTELPFYHSSILWVLFCIVLAKTFMESGKIIVIGFPAKFAPKIFGVLIPLFTVIFMVSGLQSIKLNKDYERTGSVDVTYLEKVSNPLPIQTRYEFNAMVFRLKAAIGLGLPEELHGYLAWSEKLMRRQTRTEQFYNHHLALTALNRNDEADALYQHALKIYPDNQRVSYRYIHAYNYGEEALEEYVKWNNSLSADELSPELFVHKINALVQLDKIKLAVDALIAGQTQFPQELNLNSVPRLKPYVRIEG